ncbi:hypothetical protein AAHC03_027017 [Spirometra sp. Aus1]
METQMASKFMRFTDLVLAWLLPLTLGDQCIWYGLCPTQDSEGMYCAKNVSATPLRNTSDGILQTLLELCPDYASPGSSAESVPVCCDAAQVNAFSVGIQSASVLLGRCPACFANFRRLFCFPLSWFVMFLVFVGLLTIFVANEFFQTCNAARRRRQQDHLNVNSEVVISTPPSNPSSLSFHARLGPAVEATLSKVSH